MRARFVVPLMGLIAGVILAGCGGGGSSSTIALSKSDFVAQGNAICAKGDKETEAAAKKVFSQPPSKATVEKFVTDTVVPNIQGQIDAIGALSPPAGDEDQVQAIVDAAQSALDKAKADPSLLTEQGSGSDPFAEADKLADDYGLDACGSNSA